jgi:hypothetical protein
MDELIRQYAEKFQQIHDDQTAGYLTFEAILANLATEAKPLLDQLSMAEVRSLRTRR